MNGVNERLQNAFSLGHNLWLAAFGKRTFNRIKVIEKCMIMEDGIIRLLYLPFLSYKLQLDCSAKWRAYLVVDCFSLWLIWFYLS